MQRTLLAWGRDNFSGFPWRHEQNLFHALVAEVLLQRTRAEQVVPVYKVFVARFPDPASLAVASASQVQAVIAPLGLAWRARLLPELGRKLTQPHAEIPSDPESLRTIPGVGPYAAAAFSSLHGGCRAAILDSNIVRFYGRFFGFPTGPETRRNKSIVQLADRLTPERHFREFNYALIDFTRSVCRPKARHDLCPLAAKCSLYSASLRQSEPSGH